MKRDARNTVIAVMAVAIALLVWALIYFARDELGLTEERAEDEIAAESKVAAKDGYAAVRVSRASQEASGLAVRPLASARIEGAAEVYGVVVDPTPLFDLRARYLAAAGNARALRAAAASSADEHRRLKALFADDRNASERAVLAAEAQWRGDQARLAAADQAAAALADALRAEWGTVIAAWATEPDQRALDAYATQREVLVQFAFTDESRERAARTAISVAPIGGDTGARPARFVSPAPRTDATLRGPTYFYATRGQGLRVGMRVVGRVGLGGKPRDGVVVPSAAVVWHGGKAWAYAKDQDELFVRREVSTADAVGDGWFDASHFSPGQEIVVVGAQLLLSEELRYQIRNENKD